MPTLFQNNETNIYDYQYINAYPGPDEVLIDKRPILRKNIINGSYKSVEHYLDTHFRLLREDFLGPLRKSICAYRNNLKNNPNEFQIYPKVQFVKTLLPSHVCTLNYMGAFKKTNLNCTYEKLNPGKYDEDDFMIGNLLCFSSDNFETVFFGIVKAGDFGVKQSLINVELLEEGCVFYNQYYTLLISKNYFNPYYLVLKALKTFNNTRFPMEKYIINLEKRKEMPKYFEKSQYFNYTSWPTKESLNLNEMQYEAYKHGLTSKFAIIQGPPGTGKTYLGRQIVKKLIEIKNIPTNIYSSQRSFTFMPPVELSTPILVVAFTNHALDQFLEGLLPYTKNIIRMGSQSKNNKIQEFNFIPNYRHSRDINTQLVHFYNRIRSLLENNASLKEELENILLYKGIFDVTQIILKSPELRNISNTYSSKYGLLLKKIAELCLMGRTSDSKYHSVTISDLQNHGEKLKKREGISQKYQEVRKCIQKLKEKLKSAEEYCKLNAEKRINNNVSQLNFNDPWSLYFHLLNSYIQYLKNSLKHNNSQLKQLWEEVEKFNQILHCNTISKATIVGMTTSGAAQNQYLLEHLQCRVVIIEEASEVPESHIIACLTPHCQHVILIGDHQQLRPNTSDYEIGTKYNFGISLFERMILNGVCYKTLEIQHRMRPEISRLIAPAIYPTLKNHPSTYNFPNIQGIKHNVFFINHTYWETDYGNSKKNIHEASYVIALARHLILQNINANQITILTTYKGQMHEILEKQKNSNFELLKTIQVTTVDNFQGEENQIILLSLVRSNKHNRIGFLKIENRVCVALSRAKYGFYMIGNMKGLSQDSRIWPKIKQVPENNNQIGYGLQLVCQLHPQKVTTVTTPEHFLNVSEGGCDLLCNTILQCGHRCKYKCHILDRNHKMQYVCTETYSRTLPCWHVVTLPCKTNIKDYKCKTMVNTILGCGHSINKPCFKNANDIKCTVIVGPGSTLCGQKWYRKDDIPAHYDTMIVKQPVSTSWDCNIL